MELSTGDQASPGAERRGGNSGDYVAIVFGAPERWLAGSYKHLSTPSCRGSGFGSQNPQGAL